MTFFHYQCLFSVVYDELDLNLVVKYIDVSSSC